MTNLNDIISAFSIEEQKNFVISLVKKNKRSDTKNVQLFKLLVENELSSEEIQIKLYNNKSKDAYHALRKRLYQSIIDFVANSNMDEENSVDMKVIKYILASRSFLLHKHYIVAYKILNKAEKLAQEHYLFSILNEIYHTKIQYAYANPSIEVDAIILKFRENQRQLFLEEQLNIVYAKIRQSINNKTYKGEVIDFGVLLEKTLNEYDITISDEMSFKSLYQLMTIVSISGFAANDYLEVEPYLMRTYKSIQHHKDKSKQLYYHIQVLYLVANTLFRNKKFHESLQYLDLMNKQMLLRQKKYYNTFKLKYNSLLAFNHNYIGEQSKAIRILEPIVSLKHSDFESLFIIYLSLVMFYIQNKEYKKAHNLFAKFYHTDKWYESKAGVEWVIKKNLVEIILHIELGNIDLVDSRILSFKRNHYPYLKKIEQHRVITYLSFVERYYKNPEEVATVAFKDKVETSFVWVESKREDIFVMSFYAWLKSKMEKKGLYETTINLIKSI